MRKIIYLFAVVGLCNCFLLGQDYPKAEITNGLIHAELMLPDAQHGSYQGTRFDWSGVISSLQYKDHQYFGRWYEHHDPKIHDAITGPVEEFRTNDSGLGYDEAKVGGTFVRIGIGTVRKPDEKAYRPYDTYEVVDPGKWTIRKHKDRIEFTQRLTVGRRLRVRVHQDGSTGERQASAFAGTFAKKHRQKNYRYHAIQPQFFRDRP